MELLRDCSLPGDMPLQKTTKRLYLIPAVSKALDILEILQAENQPMMLEAVHRRAVSHLRDHAPVHAKADTMPTDHVR